MKIITKFTLKSLKLNKKRTVGTIIGILISIMCSLFDGFLSPYITKLFTNFIK